MLTFAEIGLSFKNHREEKTLPHINRVWSYLEQRGITRTIADACGLHVLPAVELIAAARRSPNVLQVDNRAAVVFPHYKLGDKENLLDWWSARLVPLEDSAAALRLVTSFAQLIDPAKARTPGKMFCPPAEPPRAYLPPTYDWLHLADNARVYIHESCIKAINGARLGMASVGLNGVWGWTSRKHNIALVEDLRDLPWRAKKLQPIIVFDSNAMDNWQVQQAESALAAKLMEVTGRQAGAIRVPKAADGTDQGFDDYCVRMGDAAAIRLLRGDAQPVDISDAQRMLLQLNSEVCVVRELGRIAEIATGDLMSRPTFTDVNYAHFVYTTEDDRQVNVPRVWLTRSDRVEVQSLEYSPGRPQLVRSTGGGALPNLNMWRGMGTDPEPGDADPWLELLANNVPDEELRQWITAWCAYPLQNLGKKMSAYILVFGPSGTGKNLFFKPFHAIYGGNAVILDTDAMKSQFTSFYAQRQFVHADELVRARGEEDAVSQRVKAMVTQEKIKVNKKGQPEYDVDNHLNLVITSNYWDCVKLDADDRRACVVKWGPGEVDHRGDQAYWQRYVRWADSAWGPAALYNYLLNLDISWFDPAAWAPETPWKQEVRSATMSPMEQWAADLLVDPETVLPLPGKDKALWTAKELAVLYYGESEAEISPGKIKSLANVLRNAGFRQACEGKLIRRTSSGTPERFWIIQQRDKTWDLKGVQAHLRRL